MPTGNPPAARLAVEALESRDVPSGDGLKAAYFDTANFGGATLTRIDPTVNFTWGAGSFAAGFGADTFSARWTGQVQARYSEAYTFQTLSDDAVRLWVNGKLLIDHWAPHGLALDTGTITLA